MSDALLASHMTSVLLNVNVVSVSADVDFVSPLCSQVVYEGLVDDIFRIKCGEFERSLWRENDGQTLNQLHLKQTEHVLFKGFYRF